MTVESGGMGIVDGWMSYFKDPSAAAAFLDVAMCVRTCVHPSRENALSKHLACPVCSTLYTTPHISVLLAEYYSSSSEVTREDTDLLSVFGM